MDKSLQEHLTLMIDACGALTLIEQFLENNTMFGAAYIVKSIRRDVSNGVKSFEDAGLDKTVPLQDLMRA